MEHLFIINPKSGKDDAKQALLDGLKAYEGKLDFQVYYTTGERDATRFVREKCQTGRGPMRFYACGGDGTLNEVVSGAVGCERAEVAVYPCGSGNDFVKYYGGKEAFLDLDRLIGGKARKIDVMRAGDRYSVNVVNFGFDSCVADTMMKVRRMKVLGGKNAYKTAVFVAVLSAMKNKCDIKVDGTYINRGNMLLCTIANGKYVGGSFCCAPRSVNDDGLLEVCMVRAISRRRFISLLGPYGKGEHIGNPKFEDCIVYLRGKEVELEAPVGFKLSLDGEMTESQRLTIKVMPKALNFIVPKGL